MKPFYENGWCSGKIGVPSGHENGVHSQCSCEKLFHESGEIPEREVQGLLKKTRYVPYKDFSPYVTMAVKSPKEVWNLTHEDGDRSRCVFFIFQSALLQLFTWSGAIVPLGAVAVPQSTGSFSIFGNEVEKWQAFISHVVMSPLLRHASEILSSFYDESVDFFVTQSTGFFAAYAQIKARVLTRLFAWRGIIVLLGAASLLRTLGLFPLSEHLHLLLLTLHSSGTYWHSPARIRRYGHVEKVIRSK